MKRIALLLLVIAGTAISAKTFAQSPTGTICFIRVNGYVGSMVNDRVYIDDSLACKLANNQYSLHNVSTGKHTVSVVGTGISNYKKSPAFTIQVEEGKTNYIDIAWADNPLCEEITKASADVKLKKAKENKKCLGK